MPVTTDIAASYRRPAQVLRALLARETSEPRNLAYLMAACGVMFVAYWPKLSRDAYLQGTELQPALGGALLAWLMFWPLIFYVIAWISHLLLRATGSRLLGSDARMALFWALLAASPLALLNGLVAGFIGPGLALTLVGIGWVVAFVWFWSTGLREAHRKVKEDVA